MILVLAIFPLSQLQSEQLKTRIAELDRQLTSRYGDRYLQLKQRLDRTKDWYTQTKSAAQASGTIPLEQRQAETDRRVAEAGSGAARKEAAIKQQIKDLWHSIKNR